MHIPARIAAAAVVLGAVAVPVGIGVALDITQQGPPVASACEGLVGHVFVRTELFFGLTGPCSARSTAR